MTNRKLHMCFRLVPKSVTLDDLERPFRTLFQNACISGDYHKNLNKDRPLLSVAKMSTMTVVSGNMQIFAGVPWRRGVRHWSNRKCRFSGLSEMRPKVLYSII